MSENPIEPSKQIRLHTLLQRYLDEISIHKSPTTQAQENRIARHLIARLGMTILTELTPLVLTKFRDTRLREASAGAVTRDLALLSLVIETAIQTWKIPLQGNPLNNVPPPPTIHGRGRQLRSGERLRLLSACRRYTNPMLAWIVGLILETGMRKGEVVNLHRSHIDLAQRVAHLPKMGNWAPRNVPLTKQAVSLLQEALLHAQETPDTPLLFFGEPGKFGRRKPYAVDRVLRQIMGRANIKPFSCEDLRDDAIARLEEAGLNKQEVTAITGTRSVRIDRRADHLQINVLVQRLDELEL